MSPFRTVCRFIIPAVLIAALSQPAWPQPPAPAGSPQLRFSFTRTPWQDVLHWLAKNANLSLHLSQLPPGSFTYSDPNTYTPEQAIDRLNLFLIPQRYSLVRTSQLLSVISLDDETSLRLLDTIAPLATPGELPTRNQGEVVKCLFPLANAPPDQVLQELSSLLLIREPALLRASSQILVIDTAAKQQTVHQILARLSATADPAAAVRHFDLGHLDAERTLVQLRPHVGLEPLAMTGPGISLSFDSSARRIYASGVKEKLHALDGVFKMIRDSAANQPDRGRATFRTHPLAGADIQTVVPVLQSLLADEDVRLAPDAASNQIAVFATNDIHALVEKTIAQLAQTDAIEFKAIPLGANDLRRALFLLHGIFGTASDPSVGNALRGVPPRIDADPATNRLLIRAKASQIAEIERILDQLNPARDPHNIPTVTMPRLAVFYLEHCSAGDADRLLRRLLAAESLSAWEISTPKSESAVSQSVVSRSSDQVVSRSPDHSAVSRSPDRDTPSFSPWTFNSTTIIADSRLNRIFAFGVPADLIEIEHHLRIVDREASVAEVRIHGAPRVIHLHHAKAEDIAAVLRDAYAGRIAATSSERREAALQVQRQQQNPQNPRGDVAAAAAAVLANTGDTSQQPTMTLATDAANNSLIITAPKQLADQVEALALTLDRQMQQLNEATAEVVRVIPSRNAKYIHTALKRLQGEPVPETKELVPSAKSSPPRRPSPSPSGRGPG